VVSVTNIPDHRDGLRAQLLDCFDDVQCLLLIIANVDSHARSMSRQLKRNGTANVPSGASDDGDLPSQLPWRNWG
jgi:hypothetical protein